MVARWDAVGGGPKGKKERRVDVVQSMVDRSINQSANSGII
jgi:hypothetical protein